MYSVSALLLACVLFMVRYMAAPLGRYMQPAREVMCSASWRCQMSYVLAALVGRLARGGHLGRLAAGGLFGEFFFVQGRPPYAFSQAPKRFRVASALVSLQCPCG